MLKKIITTFCCMFLYQASFADNCPSVDAIKKHDITGWKLFDSDEGTPLSANRETNFVSTIKQFALAEWSNQGKNVGTIHCYYRDENGSDLEAYLAKENFTPATAKSYWYQVSGAMHCAAGSDKCLFDKSPVMASN